MLPPGFSADVAPTADQAALRPRLHGAQTVARLTVGGCVCVFQLARDGEDERHLRRRYAALGVSRDRIIAALERHRRGQASAAEPVVWRAALAGFVAEHARNAGPTLFYLGFGAEPGEALPAAPGEGRTISAAAVRAAADTWLEEGRLLRVTR